MTTAGLGDLPWLGDQTRPRLFSLSASAAAAVRGRGGGGGSDPGGRLRRGPRCRVPGRPSRLARAGDPRGGHRPGPRSVGPGGAAHRPGLPGGGLHPDHGGARGRPLSWSLARIGRPWTHPRARCSRGRRAAPALGWRPRPRWAARHPPRRVAWRPRPAQRPRGRGCRGGLARRLGLGPPSGWTWAAPRRTCAASMGVDLDRFLNIAGLRLRVPSVRLDTIAAGGGSCLGRVAGVLSVGPRSAGSAPGPACYGRGGPATVTDCEAVLGRLVGFPALCGPDRDGPLDTGAARRALAALDPDRPVEVVASDYVAVAKGGWPPPSGASPRVRASSSPPTPWPSAARAPRMPVAWPSGRALPRGGPLLASTWSAVGIGRARRRAEVVVPVRADPHAAVQGAGPALPRSDRAGPALPPRGTDTVLPVPLGSASAPPGARLSGRSGRTSTPASSGASASAAPSSPRRWAGG